jgi:pimeloyl-ACP methyl ester carboxylesterase
MPMKTSHVLLLAAVAIVAASVVSLGINASTPPLRDAHGAVLADGIAELVELELGGARQWVSIRGEDRSDPVLLWLHGGPGAAQMPLAHRLDGRLEQEFVVVHWDQRGAGKSNDPCFDERTMTVEQFLSDAHELTTYLRARLGQERIFLLGHSWGSQLGIALVDAYPEDYHAYVGVSQVVDSLRATELAYEWLVQEVERSGNEAHRQELERIGPPPYLHADYRTLARLVDAYGGSSDLSMWRLALLSFGSPQYTVLDYPRWLDGMKRGGAPLHAGGEMIRVDHITSIPAVEVPIHFFVGARDVNTPHTLVQEYYDAITAPSKSIVVFEDSAHTPFLAENERFVDELVRVKRTTLQ